jgi:hypothetical protein
LGTPVKHHPFSSTWKEKRTVSLLERSRRYSPDNPQAEPEGLDQRQLHPVLGHAVRPDQYPLRGGSAVLDAWTVCLQSPRLCSWKQQQPSQPRQHGSPDRRHRRRHLAGAAEEAVGVLQPV